MASPPGNPIRPALLVTQDIFKRDHAFVRHLLQGLADEGISTLRVDYGVSGRTVSDWEGLGPGVRFPEIDLPLMQPFNIRRLLMHLECFDPSVLHCLSEDVLPLAQILAASLRVNIVVRVNRLQIRSPQLTISNRHCRVLVAPCASIGASIVRWHPRYADRVREMSPWTERPEQWREGMAGGTIPCLVVAADHASIQGLVVWLRCFQECRQQGLAFMVAMLVVDEQETSIRRALHELDLDDIVTLISDETVWHDVLRAGDALVIPAPLGYYDSRLMAAMAQGLAVIACTGGVDDGLVPNQTAWLVQAGDKAGYLAVLLRLLEHPDQARLLAATCREYTFQTMSNAASGIDPWIELYQDTATSVDGLEKVAIGETGGDRRAWGAAIQCRDHQQHPIEP